MEHLLQKSKCSIFHNIFEDIVFQRHQKVLLWSNGLSKAEAVKKKMIPNGFFVCFDLIMTQSTAMVMFT